jgi:hypothetical protein
VDNRTVPFWEFTRFSVSRGERHRPPPHGRAANAAWIKSGHKKSGAMAAPEIFVDARSLLDVQSHVVNHE